MAVSPTHISGMKLLFYGLHLSEGRMVLQIAMAPFTELPYMFISVFDQVWLSRQRAGLQVTKRDL